MRAAVLALGAALLASPLQAEEAPVARPTGKGTSSTAEAPWYREARPFSMRLWLGALYLRDEELLALHNEQTIQRELDRFGAVRNRGEMFESELRLMLDYGWADQEGFRARIDGAFDYRLVEPAPGFGPQADGYVGGPVCAEYRCSPPYRLTEAWAGYRGGSYEVQVGRSVEPMAGYQIVDGVLGRYRQGAWRLSAFGGLAPHPYTQDFDPRFQTGGVAVGYATAPLRFDLGLSATLFAGQLDRISISQRGHYHPDLPGLAFASLLVVDAASAVGVQVRHLSLSADYVPRSRSRIGVSLSHLGAPLPGQWTRLASPVEAQRYGFRVDDVDYLYNEAIFASVDRTNLRIYGVLGVSDSVVLYAKSNLQRRGLLVGRNETAGRLDLTNPGGGQDPPTIDTPLSPTLQGDLDTAVGATVGARTFQAPAGLSLDASYSYLLNFASTDQLATLRLAYGLGSGALRLEVAGTVVHSQQLTFAAAQRLESPERLNLQTSVVAAWRLAEGFGLVAHYQNLLGPQRPQHLFYARFEFRY